MTDLIAIVYFLPQGQMIVVIEALYTGLNVLSFH